ncbi:hypothetical protein FACS1894188_03670 [Clostridia bacterium]|nr:hypothetical protein FACS1894188_03670 [Clostridia bacterium]
MTRIEFERRNSDELSRLLREHIEKKENGKMTESEQDIYNLKYMRYSIGHGSRYFRYGYIATLDRAIARIEKDTQ